VAWRSRTWQPQRLAASWRRQSASTVTASGPIPPTSQNAISGVSALKIAQTRSQSPGRSSREIGPWIEKAVVFGRTTMYP